MSENRCKPHKRLIILNGAILLLLFGDSFTNGFFAFGQNNAVSVIEYKIGARDLLEIKVLELPELNQTVRVSEDGSINITLLGKVVVSDLTVTELEKALADLLNKQYTKDAHVSVLVKEFQKAAVFGAVGQPGEYELVGPTNLLQIIAKAGGLTAQAANELFIFRTEKDGRQTRLAVKLDELTIQGKQDLNIEILPKDVVTIPIDQTLNVFIYGEVKTPGVVPFLSSKKITLLQAIAQAGGPTEWANKRNVIIKRKDKKSGKELKIPANLNSIIKGKAPDIVLEEGDIVIVS